MVSLTHGQNRKFCWRDLWIIEKSSLHPASLGNRAGAGEPVVSPLVFHRCKCSLVLSGQLLRARSPLGRAAATKTPFQIAFYSLLN